MTVEERRRGRAGGHEPTCRLGQKLWLQRGEVRRGGILMTQKPARQVWRGGMPQIPPSSSSSKSSTSHWREGGPLPPCQVEYIIIYMAHHQQHHHLPYLNNLSCYANNSFTLASLSCLFWRRILKACVCSCPDVS